MKNKPIIKFVENEADKLELFAEFYYEQEKDYNIIITLLIDSFTNEVKETHILKEYFDNGEYLDTENINDTHKHLINTDVLVNILTENEKNENLTRNYYHYGNTKLCKTK